MIDEHGLHPDVTPVVAASLHHITEDDQKRAAKAAREKKMRRTFAVAIASAVILASLGAVMLDRHHDRQRVVLSNTSGGNAHAGVAVDARRVEILRRIDEARNGGQLKGVIYMALLSDHQSVLVAQRRAEAHGMPDADVKKLHADLDRMAAQLDRHLKTQ